MLTGGPSRGGRNCSWSAVQSAREYGLKFAGGISMNGNMAEYITAHAKSRTAALDRIRPQAEERNDKTPGKLRAKKKPKASQAERDAALDNLTGAAPTPKRR